MSGGGFPWGLTPGGKPEDEDTPVVPPGVPAAPPTAEPLDQGHFVAVHPELSTTPPAAQPPVDPVPSWDQPTQATPTYEPNYDQPIAPPSWEQPTQAVPAPDFAAPDLPAPDFPAHAPQAGEPPPVDGTLPGATQALAAQPVGFDGIEAGATTNELDALFGEGAFQEYQDDLLPADLPNPFAAGVFSAKAVERVEFGGGAQLVPTAAPVAPAAPMPATQKKLLFAAGGLVAALAIVALFLVGTRMAPLFADAPPPPSVPTAQPTLPPEVLGPLPPGEYAWTELLGTECIDPFTSPWAQTFTVVDCTQPHAAQLVLTGMFDDSFLDPYPGFDELQARMNLLCSSDEGIDYAVAKGFDDIQVTASYAASESAWANGDRTYACFVQRDGAQLNTSVAMPDTPTPVIPVTPEPEP